MQRTQSPKVSFGGRTALLSGRSGFGCDWTFTVQLFHMIFKLEKVSFMPSAYYFFLKKNYFV